MQMQLKVLLILSCWVLLVSSGCVSFNEYMAKEVEQEDCQTRLKQANEDMKNLEAERLRSAEHLNILEAKLINYEEVANKCFRGSADLQTQNMYLKNINEQLSQNNQKLQQDLQKQKSVIVLQEKVIRLLDDTKKTIESSLKDQIAAKDIEVIETESQVKMILVDKILFESGSVDISEQGKALLHIIAKSIKDSKSENIVVEGHTDNTPISGRLKKQLASNWELSTARATAVVRFLQHTGKLPPQNLSVQGYSFYRPLASNKTADGRRQNRRIEIILSPKKK
jgi:chemotaxis protein MotB